MLSDCIYIQRTMNIGHRILFIDLKYLMNKTLLTGLLCCTLTVQSFADQPLEGFTYATLNAPTGAEWESPENLALNKEQPHAYFFPFQDLESARKVLPENSKFWQSLNGDWKFHWAPDPDSRPADFYQTNYDVTSWDVIPVPSSWNIYGIQKDGSLKYGTPIYVNQPVIFQHSVKVDDWRGGVMRTLTGLLISTVMRLVPSAAILRFLRIGTAGKYSSVSTVWILSSIFGLTVSMWGSPRTRAIPLISILPLIFRKAKIS